MIKCTFLFGELWFGYIFPKFYSDGISDEAAEFAKSGFKPGSLLFAGDLTQLQYQKLLCMYLPVGVVVLEVFGKVVFMPAEREIGFVKLFPMCGKSV